MIGMMIACHPSNLTFMRNTLLFTSLFVTLPLLAQEIFPTLQGETTNGSTVTLPMMKNSSKFTIIGLAYGQKASPLLEEWYGPAYLRFVAKHGLFASAYEADVYFVPLFVGANKAAYEPSLRKFRKSAEPEIVDHVLFSKDDLEPLQEALGLDNKDIPYFFVLDASGRVIHRTQGTFSDEKLEAMEEIMLQ
jgi:hypothetical protein